VTVFTTNVNGSEVLAVPTGKSLEIEGVEVLYFPVTFPRRTYRSPLMSFQLARRLRDFDVVHLHSVFTWPIEAAARMAARSRIPYCLAPRGMLIQDLVRIRGRIRKTLWIHKFGRAALENASAIHATSDLEASELRRFPLRWPPVEVIPNGVEDDLANPPNWAEVTSGIRELATSRPFILFLGRISWKKGLDLLIDSLRQTEEIDLLLAGPDEEHLWPKLERQASTLGVTRRIKYLGPVSGQDKVALLHSAAGLVLPSISENFGNVVLEAMAAGRPVIVTPGVGLAKLVAESGAGLVVPPDAASLGAAIQELTDPGRRQKLGQAAAAASRQFKWQEIAARTEGLYQRMVVAPK
jgi:glycosyltransferase involved in cell wall biosynthesis